MRRAHNGGATLWAIALIVVLATGVGLFTARSVWAERVRNNHQLYSAQALAASEAGLESTLAWLEAQHVQQLDYWQDANPQDCPDATPAPRWQCLKLPAQTLPAFPGADFTIILTRDLVSASHRVKIMSQATLNQDHAGQHASAMVQQSLYIPALAALPLMLWRDEAQAPLLLNGCLSEAAFSNHRFQTGPQNLAAFSLKVPVLPPDPLRTQTDLQVCLALGSSTLQSQGLGSSVTPAQASQANTCSPRAWQSVLGNMQAGQVKALSQAQEKNGLRHDTSPARNIYWVDSPAPWSQSIGQAQAPVLLVFSKDACAAICPKITSETTIFGSVYLDSQCQDARMNGWESGNITGQLVVESGIPLWSGTSLLSASALSRQAFTLAWPEGIQADRVQRISGSWKDGGF